MKSRFFTHSLQRITYDVINNRYFGIFFKINLFLGKMGDIVYQRGGRDA